MRDKLREDIRLQKIIQAAKTLGGKKLIVFGSRAAGKGEKWSDLDLCILVDKKKDVLEFQKQFRLELWHSGHDWSIPLDLHVYPESTYRLLLSQKDSFVTEINRGSVLYD